MPGGSYSVSDIQDYCEYILKKHGEDTDKPSVQIYVNKIVNRVTFKIKSGYRLELSTPETMKLLGRTENKKNKGKKLWKCAASWNYWSSTSSLWYH